MKRTAFLILFVFLGAVTGFASERSVDVTSVSIKPQAGAPENAENGNMELYVRLWNKNLLKAANLDLEIEYYARDGAQIQKSVVRKALPEGIPPNQEKDYVIHLDRYDKTLFGSPARETQGKYPYGRDQHLDGVKVRTKNVKYVWS